MAVSVVQMEFDYATDDFIPGPGDSEVTPQIWDNWTALLPCKLSTKESTSCQDR